MADSTLPPPQLVGGLWCHDVLEGLADYLAGSLDPALRDQVDAHLAGCDWCTRFGGRYARTVDALRTGLDEGPPDPALSRRLLARLGVREG